MRAFGLGILALVIFVLQVSFIPALRPLGVVPNLGLALVVLAGLYGTASLALVMAVSGGLVLDLVSGANFGLFVGLFVLVALGAGFIHRAGLRSGGPLVAIALVLAATLVQDVVILGGLARTAVGWPVGHLVVQIMTEMLLNSLGLLLLRPLVQWLLPTDNSQFRVEA